METIQINRCVHCMADIPAGAALCPRCGRNSLTVDQPAYCLRPFSILRGRYLVGRMLGRGGFGITYVGWDMALEAKIAIKECYPSTLAVRDGSVSNLLQWDTSLARDGQWRASCESFLREARKMAKIRGVPEVVRVQDTFEENNTAYIVMDFVEGITLKQWLEQNGAISPDACIRMLRPLMNALSRIHRQGIIHRDISPDNIMLEPDSGLKLLDLGAAKELTPQHSHHSLLVTKSGFSPVEQYLESGKIGPWTDVYAMCATLYYCMTGKMVPPALDRLDDPSPLQFRPEDFKGPLPETVKAALRAGLAIRAAERTQSVDELLRQLEGGAAPEPVTVPEELVSAPIEADIPPTEPAIQPIEAYIPPTEPAVQPIETYIPPTEPAESAPALGAACPELSPQPKRKLQEKPKQGWCQLLVIATVVVMLIYTVWMIAEGYSDYRAYESYYSWDYEFASLEYHTGTYELTSSAGAAAFAICAVIMLKTKGMKPHLGVPFASVVLIVAMALLYFDSWDAYWIAEYGSSAPKYLGEYSLYLLPPLLSFLALVPYWRHARQNSARS